VFTQLEPASGLARKRLKRWRRKPGGDDPVRGFAHRGAFLLQPHLLLPGRGQRADLKKLKPECEVTVLYRDMRTFSLRSFGYQEAREAGVRFVRFEPDAPPKAG
jgi:hypothetical protein